MTTNRKTAADHEPMPIVKPAPKRTIAENLAYAIENAKRDLASLREELVTKARNLASDMTRLADRMSPESDGWKTVNPLGEIQGQGRDVDLLCCRIYEKEKEIGRLAALAARGE